MSQYLKKNKNGRRRRRRPLGPKTAPQAEKKKFRPFGDQNLKENNSAAGGEKKIQAFGGPKS